MKFVVQRHNASHLHWDFRLEKDGVLKSWAVPKGLPTSSGVNRLAIPTEDHDMEWASFEGKIPKGLYGAGEVTMWDQGKYSIISWGEDFIQINLQGKRYEGIYDMRKINKDWLIWKSRDIR